ncbi:hypothetical protein SFR_6955 (plasmid) [Streptomyces sp. FR-008]|nr:hypothetical protein SFR_6955 [Streptomyces sp. FR-008]
MVDSHCELSGTQISDGAARAVPSDEGEAREPGIAVGALTVVETFIGSPRRARERWATQHYGK